MLVEKMKGLYRMNLAGYILGTAGRVGVIFAGYMGSVPLMLAFTAIAALGMAPWQGDMGAVVASCSEYTYLTKHKHIDGTMYSCTSFGTKIGGGIGVALCGWLLDASGFVKEAAVQPASCMNMLHIMYLWIPMILSLVITFIMSEIAIDELLEKWDEEHVLTKEEALAILNLPDDKLDKLIETAYALRLKYKGKKVSIQLLTNVRSGNCSQNCAYCAQSCESHAAIEKYKRVSDEKLYGDNDLVDEKHLARHCIGLSGISFTDAEIEDLADRIRKMKKNDTQICCSIGFLTEKQARMLKDAGLNRINHNLNSSRSYYPNICTTHTYDQRINNIRMLKSIGFEMCCGGIIGMGESKSDVVDMLMDIREINPESVPINFLLPIKGTRLADRDISGLTQQYCLKVLCLARLMVPKSDIRCAAGREVYFKGIEPTLFKVVDSIFASGYLTAGGQGIDDTLNMIKEAGFTGEIESTDR
mgnify:CR=1 FL=1